MTFNEETKTGNPSLAGSQRSNTTMLLGIFIALLAVISIQANQVTTAPGFGPWMIGSSGEFTMVADAGVAANLAGYSPYTVNQGGYANSFQTFCVERNEYITPSTTYDVTSGLLTRLSNIPLSNGAAYLYQQFATGQLLTYN